MGIVEYEIVKDIFFGTQGVLLNKNICGGRISPTLGANSATVGANSATHWIFVN